jgi:hypothetical protein
MFFLFLLRALDRKSSALFILCVTGSFTDCKYDNSVGLIMPATTRSKARLLLNDCNNVPQVCLACSPSTPLETTLTHDSSAMYMSRTDSMLTSTLGTPSIEHSDLSAPSSTSSETLVDLSLVCSSDFSKFQNLKPITSSSMDTISKYFPAVQENQGHNSLYFQNTNMEADCKDSPDVSTSSESPDL